MSFFLCDPRPRPFRVLRSPAFAAAAATPHEAEDPEIDLPDDLPDEISNTKTNTVDIEPLPYEEFLAKFPDDRPEEDELVSRATENSRG